MQRAMTTDLPFSPSRSRSPTRVPPSSSTGPSPFHRPPGWQPPTAHRPSILQIDLKPMQQLANLDPYYNILAPQVAGNLTTDEYDSLFQAYKVIYPDYAARHYVGEIKTMVVDLMAQRWSIFPNTTDFYLSVDTDRATKCWINLDIRFWTSSTGIILLGKLINISTILYAFTNPPALPYCPTSRHLGNRLGGSHSKHSSKASIFLTGLGDNTMIHQTARVQKGKRP